MFQSDGEGGIRAYLKSQGTSGVSATGLNHLVAAMRCHVTNRLSDEVEIPARFIYSPTSESLDDEHPSTSQ